MELKNSFRNLFTNSHHNMVIKKARKINLRIKYFMGLRIENEIELKSFLDDKEKELNEIYLEKSHIYLDILNKTNKNEKSYNKKLKRYDEKMYWERRKYKTIHKDSKNFDELLAQYEYQSSQDRIKFISKLLVKHPVLAYSEEEKSKAKTSINDLEIKKDLDYKRLLLKKQTLTNKISKKDVKISNLIIKLENKLEQLNNEIINYNKYTLLKEQTEIEVLSKKLQDNAQELVNPRLNHLNNKKEMLSNENISLSVANLKMFFGGIKAVNDISFKVIKGEIFGLIGPNGAGKTTVFNCITQFYKATSGSILFRNKENNIINLNKLKTHDIINEGIARSFQNVELIWELSVLDNLLVAAHSLLLTNYFDHMFHTIKMRKEEDILKLKALKILNDLNIVEYAYRYPYGLPYGILKKIELARTLMTDPSMIILDEPAAGLNDVETIELANIIKNINKNYQTTIFLVEHDMSLVMSICDRVLAISFGRELGIGTPKEIQNNEKVRIAYLGEDD